MEAPVEPLPNERWLPVPDFEGLYSVSSAGRVFSHERVYPSGWRRGARLMRLQLASTGYLRVDLNDAQGRRSSQPVHRLVARAFLGEPATGQMVRHLNGVRTDNRLDNLAWGTASENVHDSVRHGTHALASKTHCRRGHPYEGENLIIDHRGGRDCRACKRARTVASAQRTAEARLLRSGAAKVVHGLRVQQLDGGGIVLLFHAGEPDRPRLAGFELPSDLADILREALLNPPHPPRPE